MKNLKRALSLALSAFMLVGMMSVGASAADFSDAENIEHTDAVNTLAALNVITGYEDGNYKPEGIVKRGEMAKLLTVALNGGKDPVLGTKTEPTYTDIKGHWAESYIEYCSSLGIINGRGNGTFDPDATVTGNEAAKMMLVAMGWDSTIFNFTGTNWAINVGVEANKVKLFDGLETLDPSLGLTRDNTAQLVYNGILGKTMTKDPNMSITNGEITWNYRLSDATIFSEKFGGKVWIGTFTGNDKVHTSLDEGAIQVVGGLDTTKVEERDDAAEFPADFDIANIGEQVKVLFKDGKAGKSNEPDKRDTIYGVFNTGASDIVTATKAVIKDNKSAKTQLNIDGTKYDLAETVTVVTNYNGAGTEYKGAQLKGDDDNNSALTDALKAANGDTIKFIQDEDGDIAYAYVVTSKLAVVTAINDEKITLNNGVGTIKVEDNEVYEDVAKGDVVVATTLYAEKATDDGAYTIVEEAEVVTGEVNGFKAQDNVKLDGETYSIYMKEDMLTSGLGGDAVAKFTDDYIGESFDLYLVNGFVKVAVQTTESANNYSLVTAVKGSSTAGGAFDALQLQVMAADGAKTIITVSEDSADNTDDKLITDADYKVGDIVVYTGDANDAVVTVKASTETGKKSYNENTKAFDGKVVTANAVLFAEVSDVKMTDTGAKKFKAYDLRSLDGFDATITAVVTNLDGKVVAVFADLETTPAGATDNTVYGIVSDYSGRVKIDGSYYYTYTVENDAEVYTLNMSGVDEDVKVGNIVSFEPTADNTYAAKDVDKVTTLAAYVKEYNEDDNTITVYTGKTGNTDDGFEGDKATQATYALDDDCAILYVNADGNKAGSDIGVNHFDTVTGYKNAFVVTKEYDGEDVVVAIIVETSNKCDIDAIDA